MNYQESESGLKKIQALLAEKRLEVPADTEVDRFLIELHRRQRAQLLKRQSDVGYLAFGSSFFRNLFSPISVYGTAMACAVVVSIFGFHNFQSISPASQASAAPIHHQDVVASATAQNWQPHQPGSYLANLFKGTRFSKLAAASSQSLENLSLSTSFHNAPRFVLANSQVAYDAQASF